MGRLDDLDLDGKLRRDEYAHRLVGAQRRFLQLRLTLGGQLTDGTLGPGLLVVMEGPDAAGKGGAIRRIVEPLDPRHYRVSTFSKPDADEKRHHFLRRFYREIPGLGGMCVYDRSWYGRVLVERVEGYATEVQWRRAYSEIAGFEETLVHEGVLIVKFWMHIDGDEQLRRFQGRERDPLRRWKITDEDWRNRKKAAAYAEAAEEMFARTDHEPAPWNLIGANQKRYARVAVLDTLNRRVEEGMSRWGMPVPDEV